MQTLIKLCLHVRPDGVGTEVTVLSDPVPPALASQAASVTQEVVEFAEYIASSTGEAS